jgi:hypothetical protein
MSISSMARARERIGGAVSIPPRARVWATATERVGDEGAQAR